jgi:predicted transcriptional regulator
MTKATNKVQVHVGNLKDMGQRFISAWNKAAKGTRVHETHVTFLDLRTMLDTLSPKRLELLTHIRQHGADNVRELATVIERDYKNVHQDVAALEAVGLLVRDGRKLSAPWDELQASVSLNSQSKNSLAVAVAQDRAGLAKPRKLVAA